MFVGQIADTLAGLVLSHARKVLQVPPQQKVEKVAAEFSTKLLASSVRNAEKVKQGHPPPFGSQVLCDHVWEDEPSISDQEVCHRAIEAAVGFASSGVVQTLIETVQDAWPKPRRKDEPLPDSWLLDNLRVSSAPDCWLRQPDRFVILDWKSTRRLGPDDSFQVATYGLWAVWTQGVDRDRVHAQVVLMPASPEFEPEPIGETSMKAAQSTIVDDSSRERGLVKPVVGRNGQDSFLADREAFPPQPGAAKCAQCRYRAICPEGLSATELDNR